MAGTDAETLMRETIATDHATRELSELAHVLALGAPLRDPDIVSEIEGARAGAADARGEAAQLRDEDPKRHRKKIKNLEAIARRLDAKAEVARQREMEEDRIMGEAREPALRARARGEDVIVQEFETAEIARDEYGARLVHRRGTKRGLPVLVYDKARRAQILTGIEHAFAQGYLDDGQSPGQAEALLEIGQIYAQAFQALDPLGAANTEGGGGGGFGPKAPQVRHVEAGETLKIMRARLLPRQVAVLDAVCGEDKRLGEISRTRNTLPSLKRRLRLALKVAAQNWRAPDSKRKLAKVRADVVAGRELIGAAG